MNRPEELYDHQYYEAQRAGSYESALLTLPFLFEHHMPVSVIDFGCGVGTWLQACKERGVQEVTGIDGPYVEKEMLQIAIDEFRHADLSKPVAIDRKYDLAISLEVAEHLPPQASQTFIQCLTSASDVVLFSAATRFQGGTNHINNNWPEFRAILFDQHDYAAVDFIRDQIAGSSAANVYKRNTILFVKRAKLENMPEIKKFATRNRLSHAGAFKTCVMIAATLTIFPVVSENAST